METYLHGLVWYLAAQSWQLALLITVVAAITFTLRHRSAHVRYLLWLIVVAKCLVPPLHTVPLRVSLPPASERTPSSLPRPMSSPPRPTVVNPIPPDAIRPLHKVFSPPIDHGFDSHAPTGVAVVLSPFGRVAAIVWLTGAGAYLAMNLLRALRGHHRLRKTRRPLPDEVQRDTANLLSAYGVRRLPSIWTVDGVGQPFVWGLLRGSIYVPTGFLFIPSPEHRRDILAHELSHVLRFDAAVNALQVLAQSLFWFHPLVWWANAKIRQEREKCCDETVITCLNVTPRDYSTAIIETLARTRESARPVPSLAVASPLKHIEERITTMLRPGKRFYRRPSLAAAVLVILIALLAVPTTVVLTLHPKHIVSGVVRIAPTVSNPLDAESKPFDRDAYATYMRTQAALLTSNTVLLQHVGDELAGRKLTFFSPGQTPASAGPNPQSPERILRQAIAHGIIKAAAIPGTELLEVTMVSDNPEEAKIIVDSFLRDYVAMRGNEEAQATNQNLTMLDTRRFELQQRITEERKAIRALGEPYGSAGFDPKAEMQVKQQALRSEELVRAQQRRESLEASLEVSGAEAAAAIDSEDLLSRRQTYVDSDPVIQALARCIADLRVELAAAGDKEPNDPATMQRQQKVLDTLDQQLGKLRQARRQQFEAELSETLERQGQQRIERTRLELQQAKAYEEHLRQGLAVQDSKPRDMGRANMDVQDRQFRLQLDQELYDKICQRIQQMDVERPYGSRVQLAYAADVRDLVDNRWQWGLLGLGATLVLSTVLLIVRRAIRPWPPAGDRS